MNLFEITIQRRGGNQSPAVAMSERVAVKTATTLAAAFYPRLREHGQPGPDGGTLQ